MNEALLEVDGVSKSFAIPSVRRETVREHLFGVLEPRTFDRLTVLDDVSLAVREGETLGIMGSVSAFTPMAQCRKCQPSWN